MHLHKAAVISASAAAKITAAASSGRARRGVASLCRDSVWQETVDLILQHDSAAIITGFFIKSASAAETDGPCGAAVLARALRVIGIKTQVWTCTRCFDAVSAAASAIGLPCGVVCNVDRDPHKVPPLLIYIERPGRAEDGRYYNMKKEDISDLISPIDGYAIDGASKVISVGDGGNEAGLGLIRSELLRILPDMGTALSTVSSDVCIPCDISNWGAYGIVSALSIAVGQDLAHTASEESAMLSAMMDAGAVDGVLGIPSMSVDGFCERDLLETTEAFAAIYKSEKEQSDAPEK